VASAPPTVLAPARSWCGTATTPPCPGAQVYLARNALIEELAGSSPTQDQIRQAAIRVDLFLVAVLDGALAVAQHAAAPVVAGGAAHRAVDGPPR
jgi:hypothetical protein